MYYPDSRRRHSKRRQHIGVRLNILWWELMATEAKFARKMIIRFIRLQMIVR